AWRKVHRFRDADFKGFNDRAKAQMWMNEPQYESKYEVAKEASENSSARSLAARFSNMNIGNDGMESRRSEASSFVQGRSREPIVFAGAGLSTEEFRARQDAAFIPTQELTKKEGIKILDFNYDVALRHGLEVEELLAIQGWTSTRERLAILEKENSEMKKVVAM
ncbi:hypothetical protein PIB30_060044, partial [Stylosanthes scabra]|nr:hypothetical protein [Stylosanthes scabra]